MSAFTKNGQVIEMGTVYLRICTIFSMGMFLQIAAERMLQATGQTIYNMFTQLIGAIVNIILDPIFIFTFNMGVAGAAIATVIGQFVGMGAALYLNYAKNHEIKIRLKGFRPDGRIISEIYRVGVPSIVMQSITSVMTVGLNKILATEAAVTVYGVYFKLQSFIFMPVFGLSNGMVPIIGYNFGARNKDRIIKTIKLSLIFSISIMFIGLIIFQIFPKYLFMMFTASDDVIAMGIPALKILSLHFMIAGASIIISSVFQAMGNGVFSLIMSLIRQLFVILPAAFILNIFFGVDAVWFAFVIAESVALILGCAFFRHIYKKQIKNLA